MTLASRIMISQSLWNISPRRVSRPLGRTQRLRPCRSSTGQPEMRPKRPCKPRSASPAPSRPQLPRFDPPCIQGEFHGIKSRLGMVSGYAFRLGPLGLGYYREAVQAQMATRVILALADLVAPPFDELVHLGCDLGQEAQRCGKQPRLARAPDGRRLRRPRLAGCAAMWPID